MSGCAKDDDAQPSLQEVQKIALINGGSPWVTESVTKDGYDVTSQYADFKLTIGSFTYTVEKSAGNAWPKAEGVWSFGNADGTVMVREDGVEMQVILTENTLQLSFTAPSTTGRVNSVEGEYVFNLVSE